MYNYIVIGLCLVIGYIFGVGTYKTYRRFHAENKTPDTVSSGCSVNEQQASGPKRDTGEK